MQERPSANIKLSAGVSVGWKQQICLNLNYVRRLCLLFLDFIWTGLTPLKQIMLRLKCLQTAVLKHRSKPMREVLKCCSQILGGYV